MSEQSDTLRELVADLDGVKGFNFDGDDVDLFCRARDFLSELLANGDTQAKTIRELQADIKALQQGTLVRLGGDDARILTIDEIIKENEELREQVRGLEADARTLASAIYHIEEHGGRNWYCAPTEEVFATARDVILKTGESKSAVHSPAREQSATSKPEHVCGKQGFGALGDTCPACTPREQSASPEWQRQRPLARATVPSAEPERCGCGMPGREHTFSCKVKHNPNDRDPGDGPIAKRVAEDLTKREGRSDE